MEATVTPAVVVVPPVTQTRRSGAGHRARHAARNDLGVRAATRPPTVRAASRALHVELGLIVLATTLVLLLTDLAVAPIVLVAAGSALVARRALRGLVQPGMPSATALLRDLAIVLGVVGAAVALGLGDTQDLRGGAVLLVAFGVLLLVANVAHHVRHRTRRVVVIGDRSAISRAVMRWSNGPVQVVGGVLADGAKGSKASKLDQVMGVPVVVGVDDIQTWVRRCGADLVAVAPGRGLNGLDVRRVAWALESEHVGLAVVEGLGDAAPHRVSSSLLGGTTFVNLAPSRPGGFSQVVKRLMDRVVGGLLLLLLSPVIGLMVLAVRLDSRGPGLFKQVRTGQDGQPFTIYKMRTMTMHAERDRAGLVDQNEGAGPLFKLHEDPRITRVGRWLRRTSLDELPQLINVVRGEMSLIGPRPALPHEVADYDDIERRRLAVRPGMTGLWQVSGRSDLSWESSMALDLHYTDNWRVRDDVLIALRTFKAVFSGRGAY